MIRIEQQPYTEELNKQICNRFETHALETIGQNEFGKVVAFIAEDEKGEVAGVLTVKVIFGGLFIRDLVVEPHLRGQGVGTKLMKAALEYGKEMGCPFAYLQTLSFQALDFYLNLGFKIDFTRRGYKYGVSYHYLSKKI